MPFRPSSRAQRGDLPFYIQADCHTVLLEPGLVGLILHGKTVRNDEENIIACLSVRHHERSEPICLFAFRRIATPFCLKPISVSEFLDGKTVRNDEEYIIACLSVRHGERSAAICLFTFRRIATPFCWNLAWLAKFLVAKPFTMPGAFPSCHPPNKRG